MARGRKKRRVIKTRRHERGDARPTILRRSLLTAVGLALTTARRRPRRDGLLTPLLTAAVGAKKFSKRRRGRRARPPVSPRGRTSRARRPRARPRRESRRSLARGRREGRAALRRRRLALHDIAGEAASKLDGRALLFRFVGGRGRRGLRAFAGGSDCVLLHAATSIKRVRMAPALRISAPVAANSRAPESIARHSQLASRDLRLFRLPKWIRLHVLYLKCARQK